MPKYKAILLDIDNTLYEYNAAHSSAKKSVMEFCTKNFALDEKTIEKAYNEARKKIHIELFETASSHNRLLYFQKMCEILSLNPLQYSFELYNIYWDSFLENIVPFDGVYELLEKYRNKICLLTDLTAHIQYRKIEKLKLNKYCQMIVTSEEAGREKPHPYMFLSSLQKLGSRADEVCMIGDSFKKDILGASILGINSIWFNHENKDEIIESALVKEVRKFDEILELV